MASILYNNPIAITLTWCFGVCGIIANYYVFKIILALKKRSNRTIFSKVSSDHSRQSEITSNQFTARYVGNRTFIILIANLAASDLAGSLYLLILAVADLRYRFMQINPYNNGSMAESLINSSNIYHDWIGNPFCFTARYLNVLSSFQSVFIITIIAVDRYVSVAFPFSNNLEITPKKAKMISIGGWSIGIATASMFTAFSYITFPPAKSISYRFSNLCTFADVSVNFVRFSLLLLSVIGFICYIFTLSLYMGTYLKLRHIAAKIKASKTFNQNVERKTLKIAATISITNLVAWFPSLACGTAIFINYRLSIDNIRFLDTAPNVLLLFQVNCTINPIIYIFNISQNLSNYKRKLFWTRT
ncbi:uncharacterized protein TRIADDRAFT_57435 [Trichoplax adhaerens]|uniref:G-protein coupled receptors family 1 profile domain-containing protein n=1 Tax=Trichoplax adhaerens TaxID=10228 RepID=B3RZF5_TRIAD|nr:hypothetical protein TRIADDRAFT_57435 [Trichoplax adhaerens]EDV24194.1 hypothetical protein TRIADDRAFT_57435 [Trichoplax adhaerens]|eukprot:XP_002113720.1 hypothetical protein TRIADDRAFT_57435 [Trichoplax adhaerens]